MRRTSRSSPIPSARWPICTGCTHPAHDEVFTVRTVFVVDPKKKIRLMITYPQTTGRNFDEILRVIDSLQLTDAHRVATPVNWKQGEDVIIVPAVTDEEAQGEVPGRLESPEALSPPHPPAQVAAVRPCRPRRRPLSAVCKSRRRRRRVQMRGGAR